MGIKIINNFNPDFEQPLDGRIIADTLADLAGLVSASQAYEGMLVYVKDTGAGTPGSYQYINVDTLPLVDLQWLPFSGGGGAGLHNTLPDLQGGQIDEYYHLTERQWTYLIGLVPFTSPALTIATDEGPQWNYNAGVNTVPTGIILSGTVVPNEGTNVMARLYDIGSGTFAPLDPPFFSMMDANGYVPIPFNTVITATFPINGNITPVDNSIIAGDTAAYRLDTNYDDLSGNPLSKASQLTYVARRRSIDEIYYNASSYFPNPVSNPPALATLVKIDRAQADSGFVIDLQVPVPGPGYVVFVVSDDLTGGDPSRIQIYQGSTLVYQYGNPPNDQGYTMTQPYTGDPSASEDPTVGFIQISSNAYIGNLQPYRIEIL